jgi:hypothetical protein
MGINSYVVAPSPQLRRKLQQRRKPTPARTERVGIDDQHLVDVHAHLYHIFAARAYSPGHMSGGIPAFEGAREG